MVLLVPLEDDVLGLRVGLELGIEDLLLDHLVERQLALDGGEQLLADLDPALGRGLELVEQLAHLLVLGLEQGDGVHGVLSLREWRDRGSIESPVIRAATMAAARRVARASQFGRPVRHHATRRCTLECVQIRLTTTGRRDGQAAHRDPLWLAAGRRDRHRRLARRCRRRIPAWAGNLRADPHGHRSAG